MASDFIGWQDYFGANEPYFKEAAAKRTQGLEQQEAGIASTRDMMAQGADSWGYGGNSDLEAVQNGLTGLAVGYGQAVQTLSDPAMLQAAMQRSGQQTSGLDALGISTAAGGRQLHSRANQTLQGIDDATAQANRDYLSGGERRKTDDLNKASNEKNAQNQALWAVDRENAQAAYEGYLESTGQADNDQTRAAFQNRVQGWNTNPEQGKEFNTWKGVGQQNKKKYGAYKSTWDASGTGKATGSGDW